MVWMNGHQFAYSKLTQKPLLSGLYGSDKLVFNGTDDLAEYDPSPLIYSQHWFLPESDMPNHTCKYMFSHPIPTLYPSNCIMMKLNNKPNTMRVFDWISIPCDHSVTTVITVCQALNKHYKGKEENTDSNKAVVYVSDFPENNFLQYSCGEDEYFLIQCRDSKLSPVNSNVLHQTKFGRLNIIQHIENVIECGNEARYIQVCLNFLNIKKDKNIEDNFKSSIKISGGLLHYNQFQCDKEQFMMDGHCYGIDTAKLLPNIVDSKHSTRKWKFLEQFGICKVYLVTGVGSTAELINNNCLHEAGSTRIIIEGIPTPVRLDYPCIWGRISVSEHCRSHVSMIKPLEHTTSLVNIIVEQDVVTFGELDFGCESGDRVLWIFVCDGVPDCLDSDDERFCADRLFTNTTEIRHCLILSTLLARDTFKTVNYPFLNQTDTLHVNDTFRCRYNFGVIPIDFKDDLFPDCPGPGGKGFSFEDEPNLEAGSLTSPVTLCLNTTYLPCYPGHWRCFPISKLCHYDMDQYGRLTTCRNGAHLQHCRSIDCPGKFKCPSSYCISTVRLCDGRSDCLEGEDENYCPLNMTLSCPGFYRCFGGGVSSYATCL